MSKIVVIAIAKERIVPSISLHSNYIYTYDSYMYDVYCSLINHKSYMVSATGKPWR